MASVLATRSGVVYLHADDNVAVAVRDLEPDSDVVCGVHSVRAKGRVRMGHKIAVRPIEANQPIVKFGQTIGFATEAIEPGEWVHVHNVSAAMFSRDYEYATAAPPDVTPIRDRTFQGFRRADGKAGTRNYIAVVSSVNCSATVSKYVAQRFDKQALKDYANIDGVIAVTHKGGCGVQFGGDEHQQLARVLAGYARHPNVAAFLIIGLGCETASIPYLVERAGLVQIAGTADARKLPPILSMQDVGGTAKTVEAAVRQVAAMLPPANDVRRETIPASEIVLALQCGGSDGNSGLTANPALGVASDLLVAAGGTAVLSETTELYGAEHLLTRRAISRQVGEKLVERIRWWERYAEMFGETINNNPSPGNKDGGLTTIYEKSLGAAAKGGTTALRDVFRYAEPITTRGFVIMDSPGFDPVSATGQVAGGCNVLAFTTGRGSCFGCKPTPSIKIATNTPMYQRMIDDMDINAGVILDGAPVEVVGRQIFDAILDVASGQRTKSELLGFGDEEFAPWSIGPVF